MTLQRKWRLTGALALALSALMAGYGVAYLGFSGSVLVLLVYWGIFLLCLIVAFLMALLDMRYIRVQYALEQRRIFVETLGSKAFRESLRKAHQEQQASQDKPVADRSRIRPG
ncbi:MAG: hypothetical protein KA184_00485 [Candidatus Hydrogenedentes bacterium]|nr:hypothetical protein [Candidatus Hydrogenedentota bacterium]